MDKSMEPKARMTLSVSNSCTKVTKSSPVIVNNVPKELKKILKCDYGCKTRKVSKRFQRAESVCLLPYPK